MLEAFGAVEKLVLCFLSFVCEVFIFITDPIVKHTVPKSYELIQEFNIGWRIHSSLGGGRKWSRWMF